MDPADVLMTAGVSGIVSLVVSVLVPRYLQEKDRVKQDGRVGVFEPLRREMTGILDNRYRISLGYSVCTREEAFTDILRRGALNPRRLRDLRQDVSLLLELDVARENERSRFYDVREGEMKKVW